MPTGEYTFRSGPLHSSHVVSGSSVNFWTASSRSSQTVHAYWYVGTGSSLRDAGTHGHRLLDVNADDPLSNPISPRLLRRLRGREAGDPGRRASDEPHPLVMAVGGDLVQQVAVVDERDRRHLETSPGRTCGPAAAPPAQPSRQPFPHPCG